MSKCGRVKLPSVEHICLSDGRTNTWLCCGYSCSSREALCAAKGMHNACGLNTHNINLGIFPALKVSDFFFSFANWHAQFPGGSALLRYLCSRETPMKVRTIIWVQLLRNLPPVIPTALSAARCLVGHERGGGGSASLAPGNSAENLFCKAVFIFQCIVFFSSTQSRTLSKTGHTNRAYSQSIFSSET